jgi:hypothetical protein
MKPYRKPSKRASFSLAFLLAENALEFHTLESANVFLLISA